MHTCISCEHIPFNRPAFVGREIEYIKTAIAGEHLCGDGPFTSSCHKWFNERFSASRGLLTPSCTHSLEMAAILLDIQPGDEVIMPSYTFVSSATAFVLRGAKIVFVDIRSDTMNIDETLIEKAITKKTKVIVPVHYAGVGCDMDIIMKLAEKYRIYVVEDSAQAMFSKYKGRLLGTIGHLGAYSFHETKNITSAGEGGLLIVNDMRFFQRAEVIREKGTDRTRFFRGEVDKYTWRDIGSSYLPSEVQAAYLYAQLESSKTIQSNRMISWNLYYDLLLPLEKRKLLKLPHVPGDCEHNGHMFYIKLKGVKERNRLIKYLNTHDIKSVSHYVPLHSSHAGKLFSSFDGKDVNTTKESERLLRLPIYYGLSEIQIKKVCKKIKTFFG